MKEPEFNPDWVSPPGETIADLLRERGLSESDFAEKTSLTPGEVKRLLQGDLSILEPLAQRLAQVLGSSVEFWLLREWRYRRSQYLKSWEDEVFGK